MPEKTAGFMKAAEDIIEAGHSLNMRGWAPATSGNYSMRLDDGSIAMTVSGVHKGHLHEEHILHMSFDGIVLDNKKPSAEAALHVHIYKKYENVRAILHVHSVPAVVLSRIISGNNLVLKGYEMLKVFPGIETHDTEIGIPIVDNSQDMDIITHELAPLLSEIPAYIIRNHGFYVWADHMDRAKILVEGLDHLLACELEVLKCKGVKTP
jgi:methylthioribulose-1-phosphate dehydratase